MARFIFFFSFCIESVVAFSEISFAPSKTYLTESVAQVVCIGDVNADGRNDIVLGTGVSANANDYMLLIYLQAANGELMAPKKYIYEQGKASINTILIADVNNDARNDIIISLDKGASIGIFYQNTQAELNPIEFTFVSNSTKRIESIDGGDLNNDGLTDLVVYQSNLLSVLFQKTDKSFFINYYPISPEQAKGQIEVIDSNLDSLQDLVLGNGLQNYQIGKYIQNTYNQLVDYNVELSETLTNSIFNGFAVGDINHDHRPDCVVLCADAVPSIHLLQQDTTTKTLKSLAQIASYHNPDAVRIGNLNCNYGNEIIVAHGGWEAISIYEPDSDEKYHNYQTITVPYASKYGQYGLSVGDINGDNQKDIVAISANGLVVLINQSTAIIPVTKQMIPQGDNLVCSSETFSNYKIARHNLNPLAWHLEPKQAGSFVFTTQDSCKIMWNNTWKGVAQLYVSESSHCAMQNHDTLLIDYQTVRSLFIGNDTTLCLHSSLVLSPANKFDSYRWQDGSESMTYTANNGGVYSVSAKNKCNTLFDTIVVTDVDLPMIPIKDTFLCDGNKIKLNATIAPNCKYLWQETVSTPVFEVDRAGIYTIQITDTNNCQSTKKITVTDSNSPKILFPTDTTICSDANIKLNAFNEASSYVWQDNSTSAQLIADKPGLYSVTVTNQCASRNNSILLSKRNCLFYLDVPTAFSPNGDNLNDVLFVEGNNVAQFTMYIVNRWGQIVFETNTLENGWDGTYNGEKLESAVFTYHLSGTSATDGQLVKKQGTISLIR